MPDDQSWRKEAGVEGRDIHPRSVLAVAAVIAATLVLAAAAIWGLLRWWGLPAGAGPNAPDIFRTGAPALQPAPQEERAAYFAEKERLLHGYGWVDRQAGTARIPIETAMDLLAARAGGAPPGRGGAP